MSWVNDALSSGQGPSLSSAGTITPTNIMHNVTGTAAINTITAPPNILGSQVLILIPKGLATITTAGNVAIGVTLVVNKALFLVWDAVLTKWIPSYLS